MTTTTVRAKTAKTKIKIGNIELDGLMFPDGSYHFGMGQAYSLLNIHPNAPDTKRCLDNILGEDPSLVNMATTKGNPAAIKTISMGLLIEIMMFFSVTGNEVCAGALVDLFGG